MPFLSFDRHSYNCHLICLISGFVLSRDNDFTKHLNVQWTYSPVSHKGFICGLFTFSALTKSHIVKAHINGKSESDGLMSCLLSVSCYILSEGKVFGMYTHKFLAVFFKVTRIQEKPCICGLRLTNSFMSKIQDSLM